ncbi:hypothetical protein HanPSC8_Chr04g0156941 [Helianthus annuus]|nr:hypothetical protein HanPSC8_Chr04g0156941 [Helianthus annuus]
MGPFQMTVLVVSKASLNDLMESGPISNPIHPSGMLDAGTICIHIQHTIYSRILNTISTVAQVPITGGRL